MRGGTEQKEEGSTMAAEEKPAVKSSTSILPCFLFVEVSYPTALTHNHNPNHNPEFIKFNQEVYEL